MHEVHRSVVLYDGGCPFCCQAAAWARRHDRLHRLEVVPFERAHTLTPALPPVTEDALHVVTPDGGVLRAGRATLYIMGELGWSTAARLLGKPPLVEVVEACYRLVAASRWRLSTWLRLRCG